VNAGLLFRALVQRGYLPGSPVRRTALRVAAAVLAMTVVLLVLLPAPEHWLDLGALSRVAWLGLGVTAGGAVFSLVLFALGERPRDLRHRI
jgi:putative peptidoglycan lipid II flippase